MDKMIVVSTDCHAGLHTSEYRKYLDPKYHEVFDQALPVQLAAAANAEKKFLIKEVNDEWRKGIEHELTGAWDFDVRRKVLDSEGIAAEIIYPDGVTEQNAPPFGAGFAPPMTGDCELQFAGAKAHNRWLAESCATAPERHFGLAVMPLLWDVDRSIKELRWAHENGLKGVCLPALSQGHKGLNWIGYDPFWEACESLGMVISFHSGAQHNEDYFGDMWQEDPASTEEFVGAMGWRVSEAFFWCYRPLTSLIWGGVLERFPGLKITTAEAGTSWNIRPWLVTLDHMYGQEAIAAKLGDFRSHLSMEPSKYYERNVFLSASSMCRHDAESRYETGVHKLMWGTDYPHPEGTWPQTTDRLIETFEGLPDDEVRAMLGGNAIDFFGFDRNKLKSIADRIGFLPSDITQPTK